MLSMPCLTVAKLLFARRNILKNRGEIKVDSKPDEGTTFILLLPRMNGVIREQHEALLQQPANPGD